MRRELTRARLLALMQELARTAPRRGPHRVHLVGGGTAVHLGWRESSIDADLFSDREEVFRYPSLSRAAVEKAVEDFIAEIA